MSEIAENGREARRGGYKFVPLIGGVVLSAIGYVKLNILNVGLRRRTHTGLAANSVNRRLATRIRSGPSNAKPTQGPFPQWRINGHGKDIGTEAPPRNRGLTN